MFTLTEADDTTNLRLLTADEIDLVAGGALSASTTANGRLGITFPFRGSLVSLAIGSGASAIAVASPGNSFAASAAISTGNSAASSSALAISIPSDPV